MKSQYLLLCITFIFSFVSHITGQFSSEQQKQIDHFNVIINDPMSHDTSLAKSYVELSEILYISNIDTLLFLSEKAQKISENALKRTKNISEIYSLKKSLSGAIGNIGYVHNYEGQIDLALEYYNRSLQIDKENGNKEGIASNYNNIAIVYDDLGQIEKSIDFHLKSLKIQEEIGNKDGIANSLNNVARVYYNQGQIKLAIEYYLNSVRIRKETGNRDGVAIGLNNIGNTYNRQGQTELALEYFNKSLIIHREIGNTDGIAQNLSDIGNAYYRLKQLDLALQYFKESLEIRKEIGNKKGVALSYRQIGYIYNHQNLLDLAKECGEKSLKLSLELGYPNEIKNSSQLLSNIAEKQKNYKEAFEMRNLYIKMLDSINNEKTYKASVQQIAKYDYEKKSAKDSIINAEAKKVHLANLAVEVAKNEKQVRQKWYLLIGLGFIALFGVLMLQKYRVSKRQNGIIDKQKTEVENQKEYIENQHKELKETHEKISDSIRYAERLQLAILPSKEDLNNNIGNSFILYKPKDVVSGDFYWMQNVNNQIFFAVGDCTGHGVPGALVSVVCSNALNRSVKEFKLSEPKDVLNKTRELVIETFAQNGKDVQDGMDIALIKKGKDALCFSGANNPLWIVRKVEYLTDQQKVESILDSNNKLALIEYKGNKQPVALYDGMKDFEQSEVPIFEGDTMYIFTDGFADQFGGDKFKKFKYQPFKSLFLEISSMEMTSQKEALNEAFHSWKGEFEQIDDVCIIGFKM